MGPERAIVSRPMPHETDRRILICLLGDFRVMKAGQPVAVRSGGKTEALLCLLALRSTCGTSRDTLLRALWPDCDDVALASTVCEKSGRVLLGHQQAQGRGGAGA
jgi:hypothetical protein